MGSSERWSGLTQIRHKMRQLGVQFHHYFKHGAVVDRANSLARCELPPSHLVEAGKPAIDPTRFVFAKTTTPNEKSRKHGSWKQG
ncbi:hypothetical protein GN958_ATG20607 [Phytophthora infestans]|uniref:Uncharacterized protein n=1 Tax=Phytophthora infestans TaxID=4787 RepID=A0A8S9TRS8_PHYIN|nr:hypothetical protein GN958_ATG20607 [Phytophthora infestans]